MTPSSGGRVVLTTFWRSAGGRTATLVIASLVLTAATADFLASDKPIVARVQGETHWFANLGASPELSGDPE